MACDELRPTYMKGVHVSSSISTGLHPVLWLSNHHVEVKHCCLWHLPTQFLIQYICLLMLLLGNLASDTLDDGMTKSKVGYKMSVHHVQVQVVCALKINNGVTHNSGRLPILKRHSQMNQHPLLSCLLPPILNILFRHSFLFPFFSSPSLSSLLSYLPFLPSDSLFLTFSFTAALFFSFNDSYRSRLHSEA